MSTLNIINPHALPERPETTADGGKAALQLWTEMINYVTSCDPEAKSFWKVARPTSDSKTSTCGLCSLSEGVLLKCSEDNCTERYHLPCGDKDACICLMLTEGGKMSIQCKNHFKPFLFCTCQEPWNGERDMTQCDTCSEWFHNTCAKLTTAVKTFICAKCSKYDRMDKEMVKLRAKNELKDEQWSSQNAKRMAAEDSISRFEYFDIRVCPLINDWERIKDFSSTSSSSYRGMENPWRTHRIMDLTQALDILNDPLLGLNLLDKDSQQNDSQGDSQGDSQVILLWLSYDKTPSFYYYFNCES